MKQTQLTKLIEQIVQEVLSESTSDSQEAYKRLQELKKYESLFYLIKQAGMGVLKEMLKLKDESADYSDFYHKVGPGHYNRNRGNYEKTNPFGLQSGNVKMLWDLDLDAAGAAILYKEYQELENRFEYKSASSETDAMYGRRRTVVVDKLTGETVSSTTDRQGSLGT